MIGVSLMLLDIYFFKICLHLFSKKSYFYGFINIILRKKVTFYENVFYEKSYFYDFINILL